MTKLKRCELSSKQQKELFRSHTLSYNAERSRFELNSTFNIVSRIVVDEKTGKSYVISFEKYVSAFTVDAVPAVEVWKNDCSGYEAHIYAFDFYGTESVCAVAYELKNDKIGAKINLTSVDQVRILAALSDYTDSAPYEKQISLRCEVRLMKNVDTGAFTIIPEEEEVSSATHHNYILKKSTINYGIAERLPSTYTHVRFAATSTRCIKPRLTTKITICRTSLREIKTIAKAALR